MTFDAWMLALSTVECAIAVACFVQALRVRDAAGRVRDLAQELIDTVAGAAYSTPPARAGQKADRGAAAPAPSTARRLH